MGRLQGEGNIEVCGFRPADTFLTGVPSAEDPLRGVGYGMGERLTRGHRVAADWDDRIVVVAQSKRIMRTGHAPCLHSFRRQRGCRRRAGNDHCQAGPAQLSEPRRDTAVGSEPFDEDAVAATIRVVHGRVHVALEPHGLAWRSVRRP